MLWSFILIGYITTSIVAVAFAGDLPAPSLSIIVESGLWLLLSTGFYFLLALGFASLVGSRSTAIAVLLAFRLAVEPIVASISFLGAARKSVPIAALDRLAPAKLHDHVSMGPDLNVSLVTAVFVLAVWIALAAGVGAWRTQTRDA